MATSRVLERTVKAALKKRLKELGAYQFWPVQRGLGAATLDVIICHQGQFYSVETKAPGKKPTPRQRVTIAEMQAAGAKVYVVNNVQDAKDLELD